MSGDVHVRFCEHLRGRFPRVTRLVITGATKEILAEAKTLIEEFLKARGLSLSEEKTKIAHIEEGFDFWGWNVRKYSGKLLIKPAKKNVQTYRRKIRKIIKDNRTAKQENVIKLLNPVIRGWANYHQNQVAKETFSKVDHLTSAARQESRSSRPREFPPQAHRTVCKTLASYGSSCPLQITKFA
jgi:hypothetical protein